MIKNKMKPKEKLKEEIEIPEGINASIDDGEIIMKKDSSELKRRLNSKINVKIEGNKIIIESGTTRTEKKIFGTMKAHIKNMIKGLTEVFKYKLQISTVHFPISVEIDKANNQLIVKNFLGEKKDRKIKLISGVDINVDKEFIEIKSIDIEKAGQCAANIEKGTRVRKKDRRVFQDGIFIIQKPNRRFL